MVHAAQTVHAADRNKNQAAVNAERRLSEQEYVEVFMELLLTDNVTLSINLREIVRTIAQSIYNSEHIGADNKHTRRFGFILV